MKNFLISVICAVIAIPAFAAGENVATSKAFVDTAVSQKQDKISANSGTVQVLANTGSTGTVGTKDIYNATGEYADQKNSLIDAATMNAAVQNAIDAEFECIQYNPNDSTDCWLVRLAGITEVPSGYTQLEYIQTDGTQYIDTGISGAARWIGKAQSTQNTTKSQVILGGNSYGSSYSFVASVRSDNVWTTKGLPYDTNYPITDAHVFDLSFAQNWVKGRIGDTEIEHTENVNVALNMSWKICWHDSTYPYIGKLFYFKAYQNDTLVRDYIPARRDSDGVLGMYDLVSGTFFTNSGTGNFIAGPMIYMPSGN